MDDVGGKPGELSILTEAMMVMMMMVVVMMMVVMIMILLCFSRRDFESVYLLVRGVKLRIYSRPMVRLILPVLKYACEGEGSQQPPRQTQQALVI